MKEFFGMMVARTFDAFCSMKYIHDTKTDQSVLPTFETFDGGFYGNYGRFRTSPDAAPFRDLGERWFGQAWFRRQMNCQVPLL